MRGGRLLWTSFLFAEHQRYADSLNTTCALKARTSLLMRFVATVVPTPPASDR